MLTILCSLLRGARLPDTFASDAMLFATGARKDPLALVPHLHPLPGLSRGPLNILRLRRKQQYVCQFITVSYDFGAGSLHPAPLTLSHPRSLP